MNSVNMARAYLKQAQERLKHAREALENGNYPYVIRQSQETVELSLKATLRLVGIEHQSGMMWGQLLKKKQRSSLIGLERKFLD
jgi:HEPN domain-containing protein